MFVDISVGKKAGIYIRVVNIWIRNIHTLAIMQSCRTISLWRPIRSKIALFLKKRVTTKGFREWRLHVRFFQQFTMQMLMPSRAESITSIIRLPLPTLKWHLKILFRWFRHYLTTWCHEIFSAFKGYRCFAQSSSWLIYVVMNASNQQWLKTLGHDIVV